MVLRWTKHYIKGNRTTFQLIKGTKQYVGFYQKIRKHSGPIHYIINYQENQMVDFIGQGLKNNIYNEDKKKKYCNDFARL